MRTNQQPIVTVKGLTKKYKKLLAVDDISFTVPKGSIFAFLGPNGAGKSTTIKMLTTLTKPSKGEITIADMDVLRQKDRAREQFGIVFQDPSLDDDLTAYENLEYHSVIYGVPRKQRTKRIQEALRIVQLEERKNDLVKTFSGGMKRRLEIGRGLIHHPKILFLDEPTTGLDPQTRNNIWDHIKKLNKEESMTIFFTTHYLPEAEEMADQLAIIDHGKIIGRGTLKDIEKQTNSTSLEEAFLKITGKDIRDEQGTTATDHMRLMRRMR